VLRGKPMRCQLLEVRDPESGFSHGRLVPLETLSDGYPRTGLIGRVNPLVCHCGNLYRSHQDQGNLAAAEGGSPRLGGGYIGNSVQSF
jgi:hypothetical protein